MKRIKRYCKCGCGSVTKRGNKWINGHHLLGSRMALKHGLTNEPEYKVWHNMKQRCHNPNHPLYKYYGGRGIIVCDKWRRSMKKFYQDMGPRPGPEYSIDRIDNDGDYRPENCRWATRKEQTNNRRPRGSNG